MTTDERDEMIAHILGWERDEVGIKLQVLAAEFYRSGQASVMRRVIAMAEDEEAERIGESVKRVCPVPEGDLR